jgi:hypothetical protein
MEKPNFFSHLAKRDDLLHIRQSRNSRMCREKIICPVIPSRKNCKQVREHDKHLCRLRVENAFLELKRWREVAGSMRRLDSATSLRCAQNDGGAGFP